MEDLSIYFTYLKQGKLVPKIPYYNNIYIRAEKSSKYLKSTIKRQIIYHFKKYVTTLVYFYKNFNKQDILIFLDNRMGQNVNDFTYEDKIMYITNALKMFNDFENYNKINLFDDNYENKKEFKLTRKNIYMEREHYFWNEEELNKLNLNKIELSNFKKSIKIKNNILIKESEKDFELKNIMELNKNDIKTRKQLYDKFNNYSNDRIEKVAKEIGLTEFMSESEFLLYNSFQQLFKMEIKEKLTYESILKLFNNKISIKTLKRYIKKFPETKEKINEINNKLKIKSTKNKQKIKDINNSLKPMDEKEIIKKPLNDKNDNEWLYDDEILEVKKIITWDEMIEIEERVKEEDQEWLDFLDDKNKEKIIA